MDIPTQINQDITLSLEKPQDGSYVERLRHKEVLTTLEERTDGSIPMEALNWAYRLYYMELEAKKTSSSAPLSTETVSQKIYLFNVLVALEWEPTPKQMAELRKAFHYASNFLRQVTYGCMAFGQVIFGGPELMPCADIQMFASNRLYPRARIGGLLDGDRYAPIRVGRALWHGGYKTALPWHNVAGFRTLIHEWAHYALELEDQYTLKVRPRVDDRETDLIIPKRQSRGQPTIMTDVYIGGELEDISMRCFLTHLSAPPSSKILGVPVSFPSIQFSYEFDGCCPVRHDADPVPLPLPQFKELSSIQSQNPAATLKQEFECKPLCHRYWLYLLKPDKHGSFRRLLPQGTLALQSDPRHDVMGRSTLSRDLVGTDMNDVVVVAAEDENGVPSVLAGTVQSDGSNQEELEVSSLKPCTPQVFPIAKVIPPIDSKNKAEIRFDCAPAELPDTLFVFPLGWPDGVQEIAPVQTANSMSLEPPFDGYIVARWDDDSLLHGRFMVYHFSEGGPGPHNDPDGGGPPITAGSSDGSLGIYFGSAEGAGSGDYSDVKVVTTRSFDSRPYNDYIYTIASSRPLPEQDITATLIFHYDATLDPIERNKEPESSDEANGTSGSSERSDTYEPVVYRLKDDNLKDYTYSPPDAAFLALPLTCDTASSLRDESSAEPRVESYQIRWKKRTADS